MLQLLFLLLLLRQLHSRTNCWGYCRLGRDRSWTDAFYLQSPRAGCSHHRWRSGKRRQRTILYYSIAKSDHEGRVFPHWCSIFLRDEWLAHLHPIVIRMALIHSAKPLNSNTTDEIESVVIYCTQFVRLNYNMDSIQPFKEGPTIQHHGSICELEEVFPKPNEGVKLFKSRTHNKRKSKWGRGWGICQC